MLEISPGIVKNETTNKALPCLSSGVSALSRIRIHSSVGPAEGSAHRQRLCEISGVTGDKASFKWVPGTLHANLPPSRFVNFTRTSRASQINQREAVFVSPCGI